MTNEELDELVVYNRALGKRVNACIAVLEKRGQDTSILKYVVGHLCLMNPDRTEIYAAFVEQLERYTAGENCDICQMLAFIGACKDAEYSSLQSQRENQRRVASKQVKNNISRGVLLALEPYIVMIDKLWEEKTSPQNTTERWTLEAVLEEIWKEHSQEIKAITFIPRPKEQDRYSTENLKAIQRRLEELNLSKLKKIFQKYLQICKTEGKTLAGKKIVSRSRKKTPQS